MANKLGIDVSNCNGSLDWSAIKNAGIDFAIVRAGWGSDYDYQDDPEVRNNVGGCNYYGIDVGLYLYSYALTVEDAHNEAKHILRIIEELGSTYELPIYIDMEDADGYKAEHGIDVYEQGDLLTEICRVFCEDIEEAGYKAGVYSNYDYFQNVLDYDTLNKYSIWLAIWGSEEPYMDCDIWQFTSDGHIGDIESRLDMNYMMKEFDVPQIDTDTPPSTNVNEIVSKLNELISSLKDIVNQLYDISKDDEMINIEEWKANLLSKFNRKE